MMLGHLKPSATRSPSRLPMQPRSAMMVLFAAALVCSAWLVAFHDEDDCQDSGAPCALCAAKACAWAVTVEDSQQPVPIVLWPDAVVLADRIPIGGESEFHFPRGPPFSLIA